jgi:hypothetical protein
MIGGIAVREFAVDAVDEARLRQRTRTREGQPEIYFLLSDAERLLPVCLAARNHIVLWGARRGQGLPQTSWVQIDSLEAGRWDALEPAEAVIPASRALDNGIWYDVREGVRAIVLRDPRGVLVAYPLVEQASHYYQGMTGSDWMPCLIRQRI